MRVERFELRRFRNHNETAADCVDGLNVFLGRNGEGKTNLVEGLSFLCLTKSFYAAADATALQMGRDDFDLEGDFRSDSGVRSTVRVRYTSLPPSKEVLLNRAVVEPLSEFIGQFPVVILSPENNKITFGSPADRRRFLDLVISQSSRSYLQDLLEYRRALRQRNKILLDAKLAQRDPGEQIDPWTENLVAHGVRVIQKRGEFLKNFRPHLVEAYREIAGGKEEPGLRYRTITGRHNTEETNSLTERFRSAVTRIAAEERRMGSTLVGPHRDELEMTINGLELRKFASQGQHRTFLIALKLAEFHYLYGRCKETPMLILDDVFSELDREREQRMFGLAQSLGQTFITATDRSSLRGVRHPERVRWFTVEQGTLTNGETQSGND